MRITRIEIDAIEFVSVGIARVEISKIQLHK